MAMILPVLFHDHFDPTWRRGFLRPIAYGGSTVAPYAAIEERVFEDWLAQSGRGLALTEGQTAVWRAYLARRPERLARLRAELAAGRLGLVNSGETVQDTNLPFCEGLVRNFLVAQPLLRQLGGEGDPGLEIGWCEDAFGNSANYPQILRGVGCQVAARLSYRYVPGEVWEGIDGTRLPTLDRLPAHAVSSFVKHPPCPACRGTGAQQPAASDQSPAAGVQWPAAGSDGCRPCAACGGDGVRWIATWGQAEVERALVQAIADDRAARAGAAVAGVAAERPDAIGGAAASGWAAGQRDGGWALSVVHLGGEEIPPPADLLDALAAVAAREPGFAPRSCTWGDLWRLHRERLLAVAAAHRDGPSPDLNPAMPGCMVTRVRMKQRVRGLARRLTEAESALADASWRHGAAVAQPEALNQSWRLVVFNQFHDAITGTMVDGAYGECQDMLDRAEAGAAPLLPPHPVAPASPPLRPMESGSLRLGRLEVDFDRRGIRRIREAGRELCAERPLGPARPALRVGELTLEEDAGDAWGMRIPSIDPATCFVPLGDFHGPPEVGEGMIRWHGTYGGGDRKVRRLAWTVTARASADGRRIDFRAEIDWDAESRRLRVRFPLAGAGDEALWEIPYGHLRRRFDPKRMDYSIWNAQQNEFPMHHWVDVPAAGGGGVALLAGDLPCARWWPGGVLDLSLLRSPEAGFCQVEAQCYEFWDNDGMRDAGRHVLAWSLWPHAAAVAPGELARIADAWLRPAFVRPLFAIAGDVVVDAWKPAEDGDGWILRLHDASGEGTELALTFAEERAVVPCDLLERAGKPGSIGAPGRGREWRVRLHRHGICTLRVGGKGG